MSPSTLEEKTDNSFRLFFSAFTGSGRFGDAERRTVRFHYQGFLKTNGIMKIGCLCHLKDSHILLYTTGVDGEDFE
ncbi:hypothetical protein MHYP_G00256000 [Metynnis hypsauchen]